MPQSPPSPGCPPSPGGSDPLREAGIAGIPAAPRGTISLIGVGLLGSAVAQRMIAGGYAVAGYDTNSAALDALNALGGTPCDGLATLAKIPSDYLILSLPNSSVVTKVAEDLLGSGVLGKRILDTTTGSPADAEALAVNFAAAGARYFDVTIAGSSRELASGEVVAFFGGAEDELSEVLPVLETFARRTFAMGKAGNAARIKLVNNLALGLNRAVLAEALHFGESLGFPASQVLEILKSTSSYSRAMDAKGMKMVARDYPPDARLHQHLKDVRLMGELAAEAGIALPMTALHESLLAQAVEHGLGDLDNSAIREEIARCRLPDRRE